MAKFRKLPVEVDMVQFGLQEFADKPLVFDETPDWLKEAIDKGKIKPIFLNEDYWYLEIETLEGTMSCGPDDWIVRGVAGELCSIKNKIKEITYEKVPQKEPP